MVLSKENADKIKKNYSRIVNELSLNRILDELISKDVISLDDRERIMSNSNPTPLDKNREFITILIRGPEKGFNEFIEELRKDSVYVKLADQIENTEVVIQEPTLESLIEEDKITPEKKNTVLSDRHIVHFSKAFKSSTLSQAAPFLGINANALENIRSNDPHSAESWSYGLLKKWRDKNGPTATAGNLLEILKEIPQCFDRKDLREAWDKL